MGAIHGRPSELLSASVHPVAEDQFHFERTVSLGMALPQHRDARGGCRFARPAGLETAGRSLGGIAGGESVRLASGPDRIRGADFGTRPLNVDRYIGGDFAVLEACIETC